jgi:hypothetical protein
MKYIVGDVKKVINAVIEGIDNVMTCFKSHIQFFFSLLFSNRLLRLSYFIDTVLCSSKTYYFL